MTMQTYGTVETPITRIPVTRIRHQTPGTGPETEGLVIRFGEFIPEVQTRLAEACADLSSKSFTSSTGETGKSRERIQALIAYNQKRTCRVYLGVTVEEMEKDHQLADLDLFGEPRNGFDWLARVGYRTEAEVDPIQTVIWLQAGDIVAEMWFAVDETEVPQEDDEDTPQETTSQVS